MCFYWLSLWYFTNRESSEKDKETIMSELSKSEYQILRYFYEFNQTLTKHELLERLPKLNETKIRLLL